MVALKKIFGPSKEEVWKRLCEEIGAEFVNRGMWKGNKVVAKFDEWHITLDTYTVSNGKSSTTYTRIRAPYLNKDGFRFTIHRKNIFSSLGKAFGMQDIETGYEEFDKEFVIKGTNELKVQQLFSNSRIRQLIQAQPHVYFTVKDDEGTFKNVFPEGVDELYFQVVGVIKDIGRLKDLFNLFSEVLNYLCHIGSAYENDPDIVL